MDTAEISRRLKLSRKKYWSSEVCVGRGPHQGRYKVFDVNRNLITICRQEYAEIIVEAVNFWIEANEGE